MLTQREGKQKKEKLTCLGVSGNAVHNDFNLKFVFFSNHKKKIIIRNIKL